MLRVARVFADHLRLRFLSNALKAADSSSCFGISSRSLRVDSRLKVVWGTILTLLKEPLKGHSRYSAISFDFP